MSLPAGDVPSAAMPSSLLRDNLDLPELDELSLVRHFTRLSQKNFSIDTQLYPLGSCTMKYNPKVNEQVASLPGWLNAHPLSGDEHNQGALELIHSLQAQLCEIGGFAAGSLQPAAGGPRRALGRPRDARLPPLPRGRQKAGGPRARPPPTAPIPPPARWRGFLAKTIPSDAEGCVDLAALAAALDDTVAGIMITNPNTLGLFDRNIAEIASLVHGAGGLVYGDGANMNALAGVLRPADVGIDVMHYNLHNDLLHPRTAAAGRALASCACEPTWRTSSPAPWRRSPAAPIGFACRRARSAA